jgi:hypothetical protein
LEPLAEVLLRSGVSYLDFEEVSKAAFVKKALNSFGLRGRSTNLSRVAVMTGLSRKEIARLRDSLLLRESASSNSPAALVLGGWHTDKDFVDEYGRPLRLPFDTQSRSFSDLVRIYAGDVPAGAVRSELRRAGAIEEDAKGSLVPLKRHFVPATVDDKLVSSINTMLYGLASTIAFNSNPQRTGQGRIQRFVYSDSLSYAAVRLFRNIARQRGEQFLESLDDWIASNQEVREATEDPDRKDKFRVGVGMYYFEESDDQS